MAPSTPRILAARTLGSTAAAITLLAAITTPTAAHPSELVSSATPDQRVTIASTAQSGDPRGDLRPKLRWSTCRDDPDEQCARFVVPRSWSDPRLGSFNLAVRRLPATGPHVIGTMFTNPGGPGEPGTDFIAAFKNDTALRSRFNIVSWDPRGVPTTTPDLNECPQPREFPTSLLTGPFSWGQVAAARQASEAKSGAVCLAMNSVLARYLGTNDVVRDLDALRAAVGDRQLTYVGYSYGTTIGRTYALTFRTRVRAMILDSVTAPQAVMGTYLVNQGMGGATAWPMILRSLPPGIGGVYARLIAKLQTRTIMIDKERVSRWDVWSQAINAGRSKSSLNAFPASICALAHAAGMSEPACRKRTGTRAELKLAITRTRALMYGSPALRLINCADMSGRPTNSQVTASLTRFATASGPEAASNVLNFSTMCSGLPPAWNQIPRLSDSRPVALPAPPLLINSTGDVATPYAGAQSDRRALTGSRLITVHSTFHGYFGVNKSTCIDRPGLAYLITGKLPSRDISCPSP